MWHFLLNFRPAQTCSEVNKAANAQASDLRVKIADGRVKVEREREQMRAAEKQNRAAQEQIREIFSQIEQINQEIEEIQAATKHSLGGNQKKKLESVSKLKPSGGEIKNKV